MFKHTKNQRKPFQKIYKILDLRHIINTGKIKIKKRGKNRFILKNRPKIIKRND